MHFNAYPNSYNHTIYLMFNSQLLSVLAQYDVV